MSLLTALFGQCVFLVEVSEYDYHQTLGVFPATFEGRRAARELLKKYKRPDSNEGAFTRLVRLGCNWEDASRAWRSKRHNRRLVRSYSYVGAVVRYWHDLPAARPGVQCDEISLRGRVIHAEKMTGWLTIQTDDGAIFGAYAADCPREEP